MNLKHLLNTDIFYVCAFALFAALVCAPVQASAGEEPALPAGLFEEKGAAASSSEPGLPAGLESPAQTTEPSLPDGLLVSPSPQAPEHKLSERAALVPSFVHGFAETRIGARTQSDPYEKNESIVEGRVQLKADNEAGMLSTGITADFIYDPVLDDHDIDLERGGGWLDLRRAQVSFTPASFIDVKAGRQILTWGTGDLLFINDMFPKDWNSYFIGRDQEYLKAPSDALKTTVFTDTADIDLVYTPRFDPDRFIDGRRISFWNGALGRRSGDDMPVNADIPEEWFNDDETAMRVFKNIEGTELAAYAYNGFWKSPGGMDPSTGKALFPKLSVYGASLRAPFLKGIGNAEAGWYDSKEDRSGKDPFINNSQARWLLGYEQELARDFTGAVQYYAERMLEYEEYENNLPEGAHAADENRHVFTVRLTKLLMNQNLKLSLFAYVSPSDKDFYLRPNVSYKFNDRLSADTGANIFGGSEPHTFFGQFENDSNIYAGIRYSF